MIKIYGMKTCPDCTAITEQVKNNNRYEIIDTHVQHRTAIPSAGVA